MEVESKPRIQGEFHEYAFNQEDIKQCWDMAYQFYDNVNYIANNEDGTAHKVFDDFFNINGTARPKEKVIEDAFRGKLGEKTWDQIISGWGGFPKQFKGFVDRRIARVNNQGDGADFVYGSQRIGIKTAKWWNDWLIVPPYQVLGGKHDFFVSVVIEWNAGEEPFRGRVNGWVHVGKLGRKQYFYKKGSKIPGTKIELRNDNYMVNVEDLRRDWIPFLQFLKWNMNCNE